MRVLGQVKIQKRKFKMLVVYYICLQGAKSPRVILSDQSFTDFEIKALPVRSKFQFLKQANYSTQYCFGTPYSALPSPFDAFTITIVL